MVKCMRSKTHNVEDLLKDIPTGGIMIEIGAWTGESSVLFAQHFDQVVCVDAWSPDLLIDGYCAADAYIEFLQRTRPFSNIAYVRMNAVSAASLFKPNTASAIYVDADHKYPSVKQDISLYAPVVKPGGYYCGHDYSKEMFPGCVQAIHELLGAPDKVYKDNSWMIRKLV